MIRQNVHAKNLPWEWISRYVCYGWRYFLAFFGQNSTARLSKWIIFNEQHYCDVTPTKFQASTLICHKKFTLQSSCPSDPGICGLAFLSLQGLKVLSSKIKRFCAARLWGATLLNRHTQTRRGHFLLSFRRNTTKNRLHYSLGSISLRGRPEGSKHTLGGSRLLWSRFNLGVGVRLLTSLASFMGACLDSCFNQSTGSHSSFRRSMTKPARNRICCCCLHKLSPREQTVL